MNTSPRYSLLRPIGAPSPKDISLLMAAMLAVASSSLVSTANAQPIYGFTATPAQTTGATNINTLTQWSDGVAAGPSKDYIWNNQLWRHNSADVLAFNGGSLTFGSGASMMAGAAMTFSATNFVWDGGGIQTTGSIGVLAGNVTIRSIGVVDSGADQVGATRGWTISANLTGSGNLLVKNAMAGTGFAQLSGNNTNYAGNYVIGQGNILRFQNANSALGTAKTFLNERSAVIFNYDTGAAAGNLQSLLESKVDTSSRGILALANQTNSLNQNLDFTNYSGLSLGADTSVTYTGTLTPAGSNYRLGGGIGTLTYQNVLTGNRDLLINGGNNNAALTGVTLTRANNYTGNTTVHRGTLTLNFAASGAPTSDILPSGTTVTLGGNSGPNGGTTNYLVATPTLTATGAASGTNSQSINGLALNQGISAVNANIGTGGTMVLSLGSINRNGGGFVTFGGTGNITTTSTNTNGILGGWAIRGTDWATVDGAGNIVAYNAYTTLTGTAPTITSNATTNVTSGTSTGNIVVTGGGITDINTFRITDTAARTLDIAAGNTLRLGAQGAIYRTDTTTTTGLTIGTAASVGTITAGGAPDTAGTITVIANAAQEGTGTGLLGGFGHGNSTVINSVIADNGSGNVSVVKAGSGRLTLAGANTFTGDLFVNSGGVWVTNVTGLGNSTVRTQPGGYVQLTNAGTYNNEFFLSGMGSHSTSAAASAYVGLGSLYFRAVNVTLTGQINLLDSTRIGCNSFSNTGNYVATLNGKLTGQGGIDFSYGNTQTNSTGGTATFVLGNTTNDYSGHTSVSTISNGGTSTLRLGASQVIPDGADKGNVVLTASSNVARAVSVDLNGFDETVNGLVSESYALRTGIINTSTTSNSTLTIGGNNASTSFGGSIRDGASRNVGLTKIGTGTQTLWGANAYTGATTLSNGTLSVSDLSGGTLTNLTTTAASTSATVSSNTSLFVGMVINSPNLQPGTLINNISGTTLTLSTAANSAGTSLPTVFGAGNLGSNLSSAGLVFDGGTLAYTGTTSSVARGFTANAGKSATWNITSAGTNLTLSGVGTGAGGLTKIGAGTLTLGGANDFSGLTTVSFGTLATDATGRLGSGDITVSNGATLTLGNAASIQDASSLFFGSTSLINLNFSGTDTISALALQSIGSTYANPGTYSASQLNTFFGVNAFSGDGLLLVAIPEPSSFAALAGLGILGFAATRRRARR